MKVVKWIQGEEENTEVSNTPSQLVIHIISVLSYADRLGRLLHFFLFRKLVQRDGGVTT